jgi:hypothetical protein
MLQEFVLPGVGLRFKPPGAEPKRRKLCSRFDNQSIALLSFGMDFMEEYDEHNLTAFYPARAFFASVALLPTHDCTLRRSLQRLAVLESAVLARPGKSGPRQME